MKAPQNCKRSMQRQKFITEVKGVFYSANKIDNFSGEGGEKTNKQKIQKNLQNHENI